MSVFSAITRAAALAVPAVFTSSSPSMWSSHPLDPWRKFSCNPLRELHLLLALVLSLEVLFLASEHSATTVWEWARLLEHMKILCTFPDQYFFRKLIISLLSALGLSMFAIASRPLTFTLALDWESLLLLQQPFSEVPGWWTSWLEIHLEWVV